MFKPVDPKQSFPKLEEEILKIWHKENIFQKSIDQRKKDYIFYDGPPFATGTPHYGHILAGTKKDVVPRYFAMRGYRIERKWGWDCHGLPVENIVEKELDLNSKTDIEAFGVDKFNEACRSVVLRYAEEWKKTVRRMGRWVDMEHDYKTMDPDFMESIWWVFKSLWDKKLIYEGHKVVPYCPRCATPLSNFETNQGYKDRQDPAVTVKFELVNEPGTYLLIWTTTPWTVPSNLAIAVGPELTYVKIKDKNGEHYIMALDRLPHYYKNPDDYKIVDEFLGKSMKGWKYKSALPYFAKKTEKLVFTVTTGNFVTLEDGTGLVHMAPYGEDDIAVLRELGIDPVEGLDAEARFTEPVSDFKGLTVFEANPEIIKKLKQENKLIRHETINHSYPHCWRCDTPLIYRPISTWFVKVEALKKSLLKTNQQINWIPEHIKDGRFGKWLEGARDWAISRNRYWGTPLPLWRCDCGEIKCLGSMDDLKKLSGKKVSDLHKHKIDSLTIPCPKAKKTDITFVRHGQTDFNKENRWQGITDNVLNATGLEQAKKVAQQLKGKKFDIMVSSPLKRARKTAEIINETLGMKLVFEDGLQEKFYGDWEGRSDKELTKEQGKTSKELELMLPPNGETFESVKNRVQKVLMKYRGKKILIVSHQDVYRAFLSVTRNMSYEETQDEPAENAVPYKLTYEETMRRVPEVLDCWFESGSMPYAQLHYPFENKKTFENNFPAEFIAESLDQTRGWFYTLHVLSNALYGKPAFKNCSVNGIILAEDGQKMSKRLKNYPEPDKIFDEYGADALRFYLMSSPVATAADINFSEKGVSDVVKNLILPIWNAYSFFVTYATIDKWKPDSKIKADASKNKLDRWILSELNNLIVQEIELMERYDLQKASHLIYGFIDDLTNWYIRRSRRRFWKSEDDSDKTMAYATLHHVLVTLCQLIAPFMPFVSEAIYRNLTGETSVHLSDYPKPSKQKNDQTLMDEMFLAKTIVSLGLSSRSKLKIKVRQPLQKVKIALAEQYDASLLKDQLDIIKEELNVKEVKLLADISSLARRIAKPNAKLIAERHPEFIPHLKDFFQLIKVEKDFDELFTMLDDGRLLYHGWIKNDPKAEETIFNKDEIEIIYLGKEGADIETTAGILVALDTTITPELEMEGLARDLVRQIQELRKAANYKVDDRITVALVGANPRLLNSFGEYIRTETLAKELTSDLKHADQTVELEGIIIKIKK